MGREVKKVEKHGNKPMIIKNILLRMYPTIIKTEFKCNMINYPNTIIIPIIPMKTDYPNASGDIFNAYKTGIIWRTSPEKSLASRRKTRRKASNYVGL